MIPTFHPSYVIQGNWEMSPVVEFDIARAKRESEFPEIHRPLRHYNILPSFQEACDWIRHLEKGEWLSFDIETRRGGPHMNWIPTVISFSSDPKEGFCIPFARQDRTSYWSLEQEAILWRRIQRLLSLEYKRYVTQNGLFDTWHLYRNGIICPYMAKGFDTMYAHRYLAADLPHALDFLVSIYTEEEYYKDESGKHESEERVSDEQFQVYGCKDAALTLEVAWAEIEDLKELGMYDYYMSEKQSQWDVLFNMRKEGFRVDKKKKAILISRFESVINQSEDEIRAELGWVPNTKSPIDMLRVFDRYNIKPSITPISKKPQITEEKLLSYAHKWPESQGVITNCIAITQQRTLLSTFTQLTTDPQGFYHASYDLSKAKTGRLASEGADEGHLLKPKKKAGPQMQNIPRNLRSMFIPNNSETDELTNFDFTQAEPHVVAWDSNDLFYISALLSGKDVHRIAACVIFRGYNTALGLPPDELINSIPKLCQKCLALGEQECVHSERYLAKRCKNGFSYKMGARKLCMVLRAENIFLTEAQAKQIESRVITPPLREWWDRTDFELKKGRWLTNIYGTKKEFFGLHNEDMLREALSWKAQSAVTHLTCHAMRFLHDHFTRTGMPASIKTQTHDSITISHRRIDRAEVTDLIKRATYLPVMVHGRELVIPHEITHGPSWGEQYKPAEWARLGLKWS
jgi:DNA polymerase I-like protein with 3'-5' exonuclease and polymerase domains